MTELEQDDASAPRTYLWWGIAATALCFAPLGLVTLWFALRTMSAVNRDDLEKAARSSSLARRWLRITIIVGFAVNLILLLVFGLMGAFST